MTKVDETTWTAAVSTNLPPRPAEAESALQPQNEVNSDFDKLLVGTQKNSRLQIRN